MTDRDGVETARTVAGAHVPAADGSIGYESPEAVQADDTLAPTQKRRFLEAWRSALADHLGGDEVAAADAPAEAELVVRIDRVLGTLGAEDRGSGTAD